MSTVHEVIEAFRNAPNNAERGTLFEKLMIKYLKLDPMMARRYDQVWPWLEWPGRQGRTDTGIDLVARDRATGELTAVQCKFYEPQHYLSKPDIDSFLAASGTNDFSNRLIISTTDRWNAHAREAIENQQTPVQVLGLADIAQAPIEWDLAWSGRMPDVELGHATRFQPRPHQQKAIDKTIAGFAKHDRGRLVMACGTGKTFTALKLCETMAADNDDTLRVLFLVPSISLLSQTLREWTAQCQLDLRTFAVCSDAKVSRAAEDINPEDLPVPVTTDVSRLLDQMKLARRAKAMTVVFSTYQSIDVLHQAHEAGLEDFDLVICDEAHRTTGVTLADEGESAFVRVHDSEYIRGAKRLYMTATPRIYDEDLKQAADEHSAVVASMDDEDVYGPLFHRYGFGEAVDDGRLTDYKVLVLTVDEDVISGPMQQQVAAEHEIRLDDATRMVGCWNGLAKRAGADINGNDGFGPDEIPMKRAVAFLRDIKSSKDFTEVFPAVADAYQDTLESDEDADQHLAVEVQHVDGSYNALKRNEALAWLKAPIQDGQCRILSNARCLSEGIDVPALDAVLFLHPRSSVVDVVQSVGRVMRKSPGKDYGYIILPVAVPSGVAPDKALADNKRFKVVWQVLNALRAHDDRFNAVVNSIEFNKGSDEPGVGQDKLLGGHVGATSDDDQSNGDQPESPDAGSKGTKPLNETTTQVKAQLQSPLFSMKDWQDAIYTRIVKNVGTRTYWEDWAADVAEIAGRLQSRIGAILDQQPAAQERFEAFVTALQGNLNDSITEHDAVSMLAQHLITKPVFDALFADYDFAAHNPVSITMQQMADALDGHGLAAETAELEGFYRSVRVRAEGVGSAEGKQQIITELYERFFKLAFAKQAEALGIVYTPTQIVDFIIRAVDDVLQAEFGQSLSDEGVHVLDPFTGTGTFIVRLLQSGWVKPHDLARKYAEELHANEIMLLAYYIAAVNIEATYHGLTGDTYEPFPGIALTDTFQSSEEGDRSDTSLFPRNNDRITAQLATDITVILGNPPYSVGQTSANDNNANIKYPTLDAAIADTYAGRSTAQNKNSLYDSYIRAYRWATDRIGDRGVVAFVSNGGWLDGNTADGMRLTLAEDFAKIWVFNLRGNARTAGELRRREKDNVFGQGGRTTICVFIGIKDPDHTGPAAIHYRDIGDYLTRTEKLDIIDRGNIATIPWVTITPNTDGDWINQRNEAFAEYSPLTSRSRDSALFTQSSAGLQTNRDAWVYNYSEVAVQHQVSKLISSYEQAREELSLPPGSTERNAAARIDQSRFSDPTIIKWSRSLRQHLARNRSITESGTYQIGTYRPFCAQHVYFDKFLNHERSALPKMFPTPHHPNVGFYVVGAGSDVPFSCIATNLLPNLHVTGAGSGGQFFPRWTYEHQDEVESLLPVDGNPDEWGYIRHDNITDWALDDYRSTYGSEVSKDDIFHYVYGILHAPSYRETFAADLKKMLPRIPKVEGVETFRAFVEAGVALMDLHVNYEDAEPYPLTINTSADMDDRETWRVTKMKFASRTDKSAIVYNSKVRLENIPDEAHRYVLGSRSDLEWLIDRYRVKTDKASGIVNDPNDWCDEHDDPRYIVDLIQKVTTVSVETMKIVDSLPAVDVG